jgi:hypothetical protein
VQSRTPRQQITVRRWGWSDVSVEDAQRHADQRAAEALERIQSGAKEPRREPKVAYNGAEGVPIREEVIERRGDVVITRNGYGARCLNTPDVLFADIDFRTEVGCGPVVGVLTVLILAIWSLLPTRGPWLIGGILVTGVACVYSYSMAAYLRRRLDASRGGQEGISMQRIRMFLSDHPEWGVRVYRTPAGLRLLALHRTFGPEDQADVDTFFHAVGVDRLYQKMCFRQACFRARVSPKPWRMGLAVGPLPRATWPVSQEALSRRQAWVRQYEEVSSGYAACRFVEELGTGHSSEKAREVQFWHDQLCRAESSLPLA